MMDVQQRGIITLIRSALSSEKLALPVGFDFKAAVDTANKHQICGLLYYGALNCGVESMEMQSLFQTVCKHIVVSERQMFEVQRVCMEFENNGIDHMPLKGTLLKSLYPKSEMRVMGDADVLIRFEQYEKIKPIVAGLGFNMNYESDHELSGWSNGLYLELHKRLIPSYNEDYYAYFGDGWKLAQKEEDYSYRYRLSDNDMLVYLFTHFAKHYRDSGIGIKHLVDLQVYIKNYPDLDEDYISAELEKLQLLEFYHNVRQTLEAWFNDGQADDITDFITSIVFSSGAFGTREAHIISDAVKTSKITGSSKKVKSFKLIKEIFMPYEEMCKRYAFLKKAPVLLPIMWPVRWVDAILFRRQNIARKSEKIKTMETHKIDEYQNALHFVGLDFNFGEKK